MAAFEFRRPGGIWNDLSGLSGADCADFDLKLTKCLNAAEGGAWSPSDIISLGGEGAEFTTWLHVTSTGEFAVGGADPGVGSTFYVQPSGLNARVYSDLDATFNGNVSLGGGVAGTDINKTVFIGGKIYVVSHPADHTVVFTCGGAAQFNDNVNIAGNVAISGATQVTGQLSALDLIYGLGGFQITGALSQLGGDTIYVGNIDGSTSVELFSPLIQQGQGRILRNNATFNATAIAQYNITTQSIVIPPTQLTQNVTIVLLNTYARNGDVMAVSNKSATYDVSVQDNAGNTLATVWANHWGEFEYVGGAFTCVKLGSFNKHGTAD